MRDVPGQCLWLLQKKPKEEKKTGFESRVHVKVERRRQHHKSTSSLSRTVCSEMRTTLLLCYPLGLCVCFFLFLKKSLEWQLSAAEHDVKYTHTMHFS